MSNPTIVIAFVLRNSTDGTIGRPERNPQWLRPISWTRSDVVASDFPAS